MSLTTKFDSIIIFDADLSSGNWVAVDEEPQLTGSGFDTLKVTYYRMADDQTIETAAVDFPIGSKLGARRFWLTDFDGPICVAPGIYRLDATYKGLATDQPVVVSYGSSAEQQSLEDVFVIGVGQVEKLANHENTVTASARYILEDVSLAPTNQVGQAKTPPQAPPVANSFWVTLADPTYHYPNGWVLMGSSTEPLPGTTVAIVTDHYQFIRAYTP